MLFIKTTTSVLASVLLQCGFFGALTCAQERGELRLEESRWQTLPATVRNVKVDTDGQAWFELSEQAEISELKQQVEASFGLEQPWIAGARLVLFDRQGRVWMIPDKNHRLLLGYDPGSKAWIQRRVESVPDNPESTSVKFTGGAWESHSGRLYFASRYGVHTLDGDHWNFKHLFRENIAETKYFGALKCFDETKFSQDAAGKVYLWSSWGRYGWTGTLGYFEHDGEKWQHVREVEGWEIDRLNSVIPLNNSTVLVCQSSGAAILAKKAVDDPTVAKRAAADIELLGDRSYAVREAATQRLTSNAAAAIEVIRSAYSKSTDVEGRTRLGFIISRFEDTSNSPLVDGYEFNGAKQFCLDDQGRSWLYANSTQTPGSERKSSSFFLLTQDGKIEAAPKGTHNWYPDSTFLAQDGTVYFARYRKGCVAFKGEQTIEITDRNQTSYRYILGEDSQGRIYLSDGRSVAVFDAESRDIRPALPTTIFDVSHCENAVCQDDQGNVWANLAGDDHGLLSVFQSGRWRDVELPGENKSFDKVTTLLPLKKGGLIVLPNVNGPALLFDGSQWHRHANLRKLIEVHHALLADRIDNQRFGRDFYCKLRVDDQGRIWVIQWTKCTVFDDGRWLDVAAKVKEVKPRFDQFHHCLPVSGGKRMLISNSGSDHAANFFAWVDDGRVHLEQTKNIGGRRSIESDYTTRSGLWIDRRGRVMLPVSQEKSAILTSAENPPKVLTETGFPRFQDRAGAIWYLNPSKKRLVIIFPDGNRQSINHDALHAQTAIVENRPGLFWIGTSSGLLHVSRTSAKPDGLKIIRHYEKDVPRGNCLAMFADPKTLWFYAPGPDDPYRLYRVELPE